MRWKRWQTTFTARQSERNSSRCTAKCMAFNFDFYSVFLCGRLPTHRRCCALCHLGIWRVWGRSTLIDVIFIYFWSLSCCVCDVMIFELCVAVFVCSGEGHLKMFPMCEYIDSMQLNSVWTTSIECGVMNNDIIWKGHSASYLRSGFGETRVATTLSLRTHTLFVSIFHETKANDIHTMINDNNNKYVPNVTMWVSMNCLRWYMNLSHPE